jgi:hypothetical protein
VRALAAELQEEIGGELIGRVLLTAEDRNVVEIECRMAELVGDSAPLPTLRREPN